MKIGILLGRVRLEEKLLLAELSRRQVEVEVIEEQALVLDPTAGERWRDLDVVLARSLSHSRSVAALEFFEHYGVPTVNRAAAVRLCGDKLRTSLALERAGIPQPQLRVAFTPEAALAALGELGYPAVLKPVVGSWGRLLARVDDPEAARAILEHKTHLGPQHQIFYLQEYIPKPDRDLRAFTIGGRTVCAIERQAPHWITNTARGGSARVRRVDEELDGLCRRAAEAVGGDAVAVDLFESERGLLVGEVNGTMEFRNSIAPTGVDIPALLVDHVLAVAAGAPTLEAVEC